MAAAHTRLAKSKNTFGAVDISPIGLPHTPGNKQLTIDNKTMLLKTFCKIWWLNVRSREIILTITFFLTTKKFHFLSGSKPEKQLFHFFFFFFSAFALGSRILDGNICVWSDWKISTIWLKNSEHSFFVFTFNVLDRFMDEAFLKLWFWLCLILWQVNYCWSFNAIPIYSYSINMICKHKSTKLNSSKFTNNSNKHQWFVYVLLKDQKVLF